MPPSSTPPWSMAASSTPTAPTPGWGRASGSWSRPTRATAASCACRRPWPWSPTSTPSTWSITAASTRCATPSTPSSSACRSTASPRLCIDHPEVQALYGRVTDRRVVTYGFSPQADVRALPPVAEADGEVFDVVIRAKNGEGERRLERVHLSLPGRAQRPERAGRDRRGARARHPGRGGPPHARPAWRASSAASPAPARSTASASSTITATIRSRSGPCCGPRAPGPRAG